MATNSLEKDWENVWRGESIQEITKDDPAYKLVGGILLKYPNGCRILDAGSGLGRWVFYWQGTGCKAYGIELVAKAVERSKEYAQKNNLGCQFIIGDVRNMPFSDNFFDIVMSFGTIEHFLDSSKAVKEFYRVVKKGGTCLVTCPNIYSARSLITRPILNILKSPKFGYQGYEKSFRPRVLAKMMEEAGFKEIKFGILPDGALLGEFYKFIPIIGKYLFCLMRKISFFIEKRQSILGHTSYCWGIKLNN